VQHTSAGSEDGAARLAARQEQGIREEWGFMAFKLIYSVSGETLRFHYTKRRFSVILKCRQMYGVLNVDEIKN
jgi:hypothetical protein